MAITGGCLCGGVRFSATEPPLFTRTCWCRLCQALGAGSATVNAAFRSEAVTIEGEPTVYESIADSGTAIRRSFCPRCGTDLFSQAETRMHLIFIRAGALDDPELAAPAVTIWTSQAPSWAQINPELPSFEAQPPPTG